MESIKSKTKRSISIYNILHKRYAPIKCPLTYSKDYELAIAVILSAQCTDARVNIVTPVLFKQLNSLDKIANVRISKLEKLIYSTGFYKNKAKNIKKLAQILVNKYNSKIPDNMDTLITLPGIGRKTANVILSEYFKKSVGITVDTHVLRLCNLWKFTDGSKNAVIVERQLMQILPINTWLNFSLLTIFFG